jgi:23S rRNA (cytidine1920-2'-O)/16S rRNA (cytidine1409-2'-O)-methyltransferase
LPALEDHHSSAPIDQRRAEEGPVGTKRHFVRLVARLKQERPELRELERLIKEGRVFVDDQLVTNPRTLVPKAGSIRVRGDAPLRGEAKMRAAVEAFALKVGGTNALDVGAAAGGFTKALLDGGARRVYAVDVGHGQLRGFLRQDQRVVALERTNISELTVALVPDTLDLLTLDLSYLPLAAAVHQLSRLDISPSAEMVTLVKPMFELRLSQLPAPSLWPEAIERVSIAMAAAEWVVESVARSPVVGRHGAVEFLLHATRSDRGLVEPTKVHRV